MKPSLTPLSHTLLNSVKTYPESGLFEEWLIVGLGQRKSKMSLEHLVPKSKELLLLAL
jgi:hypothetical protein